MAITFYMNSQNHSLESIGNKITGNNYLLVEYDDVVIKSYSNNPFLVGHEIGELPGQGRCGLLEHTLCLIPTPQHTLK